MRSKKPNQHLVVALPVNGFGQKKERGFTGELFVVDFQHTRTEHVHLFQCH